MKNGLQFSGNLATQRHITWHDTWWKQEGLNYCMGKLQSTDLIIGLNIKPCMKCVLQIAHTCN